MKWRFTVFSLFGTCSKKVQSSWNITNSYWRNDGVSAAKDITSPSSALYVADNIALPAFARRIPLLLSADRAAIDRYRLPTGPTEANQQQRVCCWGPMLGQTDGQADGRTPYR